MLSQEQDEEGDDDDDDGDCDPKVSLDVELRVIVKETYLQNSVCPHIIMHLMSLS